MAASTSLSTNNYSVPLDPDLMTPEEVGKSVFEFKKKKHEQHLAYFSLSPTSCRWKNDDEETERLVDLERTLRRERSYFTALDSHDTTGGLSRTMNDEQISAFVQAKFKQLREDGILLTRSEFEQSKPPVAFRTLGKIFKAGQRSGTLDRLWGAEYLRKHLNPEGPYRVPRYFVVIEDHVRRLPVTVKDVGFHLAISDFDVSYGEILAEKIEGKPASDATHLEPLKYVDYTDVDMPDNILKTEEGLFYIVDTEWLSFRASVRAVEELDGNKNGIKRNYLSERFKTFHPSLRIKIEVDLY